jgi:ketosteroid isomerase-like protein
MARRKKPGPSKSELLPASDRTDDILEGVALVVSAIPGLGSALSSVLSGWSRERQHERIREVIRELQRQIEEARASVNEEYVRSDEFEDLLDQTLRRVSTERHEAKRRVYAAFLAGALTSPGEPYHEQLRFLRTFEALQPDHLRIIEAMMQESRPRGGSGGGSIIQVLRLRLPDMQTERLTDLVEQLHDERLVTLDSKILTAYMNDPQSLRGRFTPYGQRLVALCLSGDLA